MTYRELMKRLGLECNEENLFSVGQWLSEDGPRAVQFPDSMAPLDENDPELYSCLQKFLMRHVVPSPVKQK